METFTFRIPRSWAQRFTGRQVRAWINVYLATPGPLAAVSEDLDHRISLRLHRESVQELARLTRLFPSEALRGLIASALRSTAELAQPIQHPIPAEPVRDTDIVSEELIGEDAHGWVIIQQTDRRGFGYQRTLPIDRETYMKARHL
jgi:hypothetical protein